MNDPEQAEVREESAAEDTAAETTQTEENVKEAQTEVAEQCEADAAECKPEESVAALAAREFNVPADDSQQAHKAVNFTLRRMMITYSHKNSQEGVDKMWEEINALRERHPGFLERIRAHYKLDVEDKWWEREYAADCEEMAKRRAAAPAPAAAPPSQP